MVKVICGEKGSGKTRQMVEGANKTCEFFGDVVFIDTGSQLMHDLKHEVRLTDIGEFKINTPEKFIGFVSGIISQNYDIKAIYIDGLNHMLKEDIGSLEGLFEAIRKLSDKFGISFYISITGKTEKMPQFIKDLI